MIGTIIYLVISSLVSSIFVIVGLKQYKSKTPVTINSGETPPSKDKLTGVTDWNHRHGRNFIIFGCMLFCNVIGFCILLR